MWGWLVSGAVSSIVLAIGTGAMVAPGPSAGGYGLDAQDESALGFVRGLGARDIVYALIAMRFLGTRSRDALEATMGIGTLVALADFSIVWSVKGRAARSNLATHAVGGAGLALAWLLLRADV